MMKFFRFLAWVRVPFDRSGMSSSPFSPNNRYHHHHHHHLRHHHQHFHRHHWHPTPRIQLSVHSFVCPNFSHALYIAIIVLWVTAWAPKGHDGQSQVGPKGPKLFAKIVHMRLWYIIALYCWKVGVSSQSKWMDTCQKGPLDPEISKKKLFLSLSEVHQELQKETGKVFVKDSGSNGLFGSGCFTKSPQLSNNSALLSEEL